MGTNISVLQSTEEAMACSKLLHLHHSDPGEAGDKEEERSRNPDLSEDLIVHILTKLPLKSLNRFQAVSKHWYTLILSPNFISIYHQINPKKPPISAYCSSIRPTTTTTTTTTISFQFNGVPLDLTIPFEVEKLKIVGCSEGVVCLSLTEDEDSFVLFNPASGQFREIGPMIHRPVSSEAIATDFCASGFFFDKIANTFKVVRVVFLYDGENKDRKENVAQVSIFTLSENSWRYEEIPILFQLWGKVGGSITRAVCVNRCMYWVIGLYFHDPHPMMCDEAYVLCFDMVSESFKKMKMPDIDIKACKRLGVYKESLALVIHHPVARLTKEGIRSLYGVWVMDGESWREVLSFCPPMLTECDFGFISEGEVDWIMITSYTEKDHFLYNPRTDETKKVSGKEGEFQPFSYSESLVSSLMMANRTVSGSLGLRSFFGRIVDICRILFKSAFSLPMTALGRRRYY